MLSGRLFLREQQVKARACRRSGMKSWGSWRVQLNLVDAGALQKFNENLEVQSMRKYVRLFALAVLAGAAIGIGGIVFLSLENKIVGAFSQNVLIPEAEYDDFVSTNQEGFTEETIRAFAKEINIQPGIVVGRLQKDECRNLRT